MLTLHVHKDVLRFNIVVYNVVGVQKRQCFEYSLNSILNNRRVEFNLSCEVVWKEGHNYYV